LIKIPWDLGTIIGTYDMPWVSQAAPSQWPSTTGTPAFPPPCRKGNAKIIKIIGDQLKSCRTAQNGIFPNADHKNIAQILLDIVEFLMSFCI
jgi:hypothetical protein